MGIFCFLFLSQVSNLSIQYFPCTSAAFTNHVRPFCERRPRPRIEMPLASVPEASESGGHGQDILGDEANPLTGDARTDPLLARLAAGDEVSYRAKHPPATLTPFLQIADTTPVLHTRSSRVRGLSASRVW